MSNDIRLRAIVQHQLLILALKSSFKILFKSLRCQWVNPSIGLANGLVPSGNQFWPRYGSPYCVIRPQWVNKCIGSTVPVYFSCLIFKLTRKQRRVAEFLHSSHIQYDILCNSVILIAVLLGWDKKKKKNLLTVLCLNLKSGWARLSVFSVFSDQYELNCFFVMIIPITWPQGPIFSLHSYQICYHRCFNFDFELIII